VLLEAPRDVPGRCVLSWGAAANIRTQRHRGRRQAGKLGGTGQARSCVCLKQRPEVIGGAQDYTRTHVRSLRQTYGHAHDKWAEPGRASACAAGRADRFTAYSMPHAPHGVSPGLGFTYPAVPCWRPPSPAVWIRTLRPPSPAVAEFMQNT